MEGLRASGERRTPWQRRRQPTAGGPPGRPPGRLADSLATPRPLGAGGLTLMGTGRALACAHAASRSAAPSGMAGWARRGSLGVWVDRQE